MFILVVVLAIIVAILLILIVLIQNPKGGGISASFSAANQIAGVKRTNDFVEKATWTLAITLLVLSLASGYLYSGDSTKSVIQDSMEENGTPPANQFTPGTGSPVDEITPEEQPAD